MYSKGLVVTEMWRWGGERFGGRKYTFHVQQERDVGGIGWIVGGLESFGFDGRLKFSIESFNSISSHAASLQIDRSEI